MKPPSGLSDPRGILQVRNGTLWVPRFRTDISSQVLFRFPRLSTRQDRKCKYLASDLLPDNTLVELIEHPQNPNRTAFAIAQGRNPVVAEGFLFQQHLILPFPRYHPLIRRLKLPNGLEAVGSIEDLVRQVGEFLSSRFPLSVELQESFGSYVIHTWVADTLPVSPTLILLAPVTISRPLVEALAAVCRNGIIVESGGLDGFLKVRSKLAATFLFLDYGQRSDFLGVLPLGTRKGAVILSASGPVSVYGPTLLATPRIPDSSNLLADSIVFEIPLTGAVGTKASTPDSAYSAMSLRNRLLRYRMESHGKLDSKVVDIPPGRTRRAAESLRSFAAPVAVNRELCGRVMQATLACARLFPENIPRAYKAVLSALDFFIHEWAGSCIVSTLRLLAGRGEPLRGLAAEWTEEPGLHLIAKLARGTLRGWGNEKKLTTSEVGRILTDLHLAGFGPKTSIYQLSLTDDVVRAIHLLVRAFGVFEVDSEPQATLDRRLCPLCRELGLVREKGIRRFEEVDAPRIREAERKRDEGIKRRLAELQRSGGLFASLQPAGEGKVRDA